MTAAVKPPPVSYSRTIVILAIGTAFAVVALILINKLAELGEMARTLEEIQRLRSTEDTATE